MTESRRETLRPNHSNWSAWTFGVVISTVAGRLRITFQSGRGCQTSMTRSQTSSAKSISVPTNVSGEYSKRISVSRQPVERVQAPARAVDGDRRDPGPVLAEDDPPLELGRRVVEVDDRPLRALEALDRPLDQLRTALHEHLDPDVVGDEILLDQEPREVEVRLRGRREADLDLLEAEPDEQIPHRRLRDDVHRVDQRLVAVAQVDRAPDGRLRQRLLRPGAVGQIDPEPVGTVLVDRQRHRVHRVPRAARISAPPSALPALVFQATISRASEHREISSYLETQAAGCRRREPPRAATVDRTCASQPRPSSSAPPWSWPVVRRPRPRRSARSSPGRWAARRSART